MKKTIDKPKRTWVRINENQTPSSYGKNQSIFFSSPVFNYIMLIFVAACAKACLSTSLRSWSVRATSAPRPTKPMVRRRNGAADGRGFPAQDVQQKCRSKMLNRNIHPYSTYHSFSECRGMAATSRTWIRGYLFHPAGEVQQLLQGEAPKLT